MALKDLPDYTRQMVIRFEGGFIGLEELAVRLGSIVPWDMMGNVVLMEDFEHGLTEWSDDSEGTSSAVISTLHKYSGDSSVKLDSIDGAEAILSRYFHFPGTSKYGLFARLCWDSSLNEFYLVFDLYSGTTFYDISLDYNLAATTLKIMGGDGNWHNVDTALTLDQTVYTWYPVLIVFDLESGYYDKLYFAGQEYDISAVALSANDSDETPIGYIAVFNTSVPGGGGETGIIYVDDVVITKNVP